MSGEVIELDLFPHDRLSDIKVQVQRSWDMRLGDIQFTLGDNILEDDSKSLADLRAASGFQLGVIASKSKAAQEALEWLQSHGHDEATTEVLNLSGFSGGQVEKLAIALPYYTKRRSGACSSSPDNGQQRPRQDHHLLRRRPPVHHVE